MLAATVLPTLIPAVAVVLGALLGSLWRPGAAIRSGVQHFTAGVVLAAVGVELLPDLGDASPWSMAIGFLLGGGAMLAVRAWFAETEADAVPDTSGRSESAKSGGGSGLLAAVGLDLLIDGLLCAVALAAAPDSGRVIVAALTLEVFFLAVATVVTLGTGRGRRRALMWTLGLALLVPAGGLIGALAFAALPGGLKIAVLAFATAALLYLVAEELLAEAHEAAPDGPITAATFFLGFLAVLLMKANGG